jgi:protein-export membrane protein SecD/preprotein translocase SecF subunit
MKSLRWRLMLIAGLTLFSFYILIPTGIYMSQPAELRNDQDHMKKVLPAWLPKGHLNLGLDLQGGVQLVLGVNLTQAVENRLGRIGTDIGHWAEQSDKPAGVKTAYVVKGETKLRVETTPEADKDLITKAIDKEYPSLQKSGGEGTFIDFTFRGDQIQTIKDGALEQAERVVRSRVDKWGVTEPVINRRSDGSIIAQLPGFKDPEKAKELLGRTAQLKFKIVDDEFRGLEALAGKLPPEVQLDRTNGMALVSASREKIFEVTKGILPADRELLLGRELLAGGKQQFRSYVVKAATEITGDDVMDAMATVNQDGMDQQPAVSLRFTTIGGKRFEEVTGANVRKRMAIVLDDIVESAPVINGKIPGGSAMITLGAGLDYQAMIEEANQLSMVLKSGALPASITILEQRQVGATLGPELGKLGVKGVVVGLLLVFTFMIIYYKRPGMIACFALILNAIFLLASMSMFGFALTLPGIAGFVLSLGMAVDANVLINERIRDELRAGRSPRSALDNGFKRVFWTVMDSHVTAILASLVLLSTNTSGPIRGFAVTLAIGLVLSLWTALYCSHVFFDWALSRQTDTAGILAWLGGEKAKKVHHFNFNFLRYDVPATVVALLLSLAVGVVGFTKGLNWSIDFVGGTEVEVSFAESVTPDQLREAATKADIHDLTIQGLKGGDKDYLLRFEESKAHSGDLTAAEKDAAHVSGGAKVNKLQDIIRQDLAAKKPSVTRVDYVGPQIGKELRNQGFISMVYAVLFIMIYLAFRFDFRFGSGAVLKLIPDSFAMLGFYLFFWRSFDLTAIAALLTGIGYSVNDVIVVFDRIRERMHNEPGKPFAEQINISLNETLTRTINTSVVTNLSLIGIIIFGPESIRNFALAMSVGIISATLTTNFVGSSYLLWIDRVMSARKKGAVSHQPMQHGRRSPV